MKQIKILLMFSALSAIFFVGGCGLKAAPQPREAVVPAAIGDLSVSVASGGISLAFTLPSDSLDGSRLRGIGGYRVIRQGPGEKGDKVLREEVRLSVSEQKQQVGKPVLFLDAPPERPGTYSYNVLPLDIYGSHPNPGPPARVNWLGEAPP